MFFAKLAAYFAGLLILIIQPLFISSAVAALRNGFGMEGDSAAAPELAIKLLFYIIYRFSMAAFSIFAASALRDPIGSLGLCVAGMYLIFLTQNPPKISAPNAWISFLGEIAVFLWAAACIFVRRDT